MSSLRLGELLVKQGIITPQQLSQALEETKRTNQKIGQTIVTMGVLKDPQLLKALEKVYSKPGIDLSSFEIDKSLTLLVGREFCEKHILVPISRAGNTLVVAFSDPTDLNVQDQLRILTKVNKIQPVVSTDNMILATIDRYFENTHGLNQTAQQTSTDAELDDVMVANAGAIDVTEKNGEEAPVIKFINSVMIDAIRKKASDIHFEPYEKRFRVRLRIDGILIEQSSPPLNLGPAISSRLKIMAKLDISERRRPQDGRIKIRLKDNREMDFRVSCIPTLWGEKIVLRLLDKTNLQTDMAKLGMEEDDLKLFMQVLKMPQGMLLITGPTGSGKTTTIYSALAEMNKTDTNISTAEDPVEFNLEGINQLQVNADIDLNFAEALRSFLRQDPDVIMVEEIRDLETAEISIKAASTGHMVLSTLHTNDAPSTIMRLSEMGVAPYLITSTVNLIIAQRLVGLICESCKIPIEVPEATLMQLGITAAEVKEYKIFKGRGCSNCNGTGIKGRSAIFEVMPMTEKMKEAILKGATQGQLRYLLRELGFRTLRRSALIKLKKGITTIEEVVNSSVRDM